MSIDKRNAVNVFIEKAYQKQMPIAAPELFRLAPLAATIFFAAVSPAFAVLDSVCLVELPKVVVMQAVGELRVERQWGSPVIEPGTAAVKEVSRELGPGWQYVGLTPSVYGVHPFDLLFSRGGDPGETSEYRRIPWSEAGNERWRLFVVRSRGFDEDPSFGRRMERATALAVHAGKAEPEVSIFKRSQIIAGEQKHFGGGYGTPLKQFGLTTELDQPRYEGWARRLFRKSFDRETNSCHQCRRLSVSSTRIKRRRSPVAPC